MRTLRNYPTILILLLASSFLWLSPEHLLQPRASYFHGKTQSFLPDQNHISKQKTVSYPAARRAATTFELVSERSMIGASDTRILRTIKGKPVATCSPGKQTVQYEVHGAVDSQDPDLVIGGAIDERLYDADANWYTGSGGVYRSTDGGSNWKAGLLPGLIQANTAAPGPYSYAGDPVIAAGPKGVFWYASVAFSGDSAIAVSRSTDAGLTWTTGFVVRQKEPLFTDKDWIVAHPKNPDIASIVWTQFRQQENSTMQLFYSGTTNGGKTWSAPKAITAPRRYSFAPACQLDNDGTLHVVWLNGDYLGSNGQSRRWLSYTRRTTGKFQPFHTIAVVDDYFNEQYSTHSFPGFALDGNALHVVWANWQGTDEDILYVRSTDGGVVWSSPVALAKMPATQFFPAVAARNGIVAVSFNDRSGEPGAAYHISLIASRDSGATWSAPFRVSTRSSDPDRGVIDSGSWYVNHCKGAKGSVIGDYAGIALDSEDRVHVFWTDIRDGNDPAGHGTKADQDPYHALIRIQ